MTTLVDQIKQLIQQHAAIGNPSIIIMTRKGFDELEKKCLEEDMALLEDEILGIPFVVEPTFLCCKREANLRRSRGEIVTIMTGSEEDSS